jgi:short-subunit dehydrogenase
MSKQLEVVVTGASSGIGRASAVELAGRGHRVFAGARRADRLEALASEHEGIVALPVDVANGESVAGAARRVTDVTDGHGADVLVNAAGYALAGAVEALPQQAIEQQFATNVFGLLEVTRAFLGPMRERGDGRVINVSSVVGRVSFPGMGAYCASKHAVEALSDSLRMELARFGISVSLIEPGFVATEIGSASREQAATFAAAANGYEDLNARTFAYLDKQISKAISPKRVGRLIADVAENDGPRARYVIPANGHALIGFMGALPDRLADRAKLGALGLAKLAS